MAADAEIAVVAITRETAGLHRAHDRGDCKLRSLHLEQIEAGLKIDRLERYRIARDRLKPPYGSRDHAAQRAHRGAGACQMRSARRHGAIGGASRGLAHKGAGTIDGPRRYASPSRAPKKMRRRHHR